MPQKALILVIDLVKFSKSIFKNRPFFVVLQLPQLHFSCTAATNFVLQLGAATPIFTLFFVIFCLQLPFLSNPAAHFSVRQPPPPKKNSQQISSQSKLPRRGRRTTEPLTIFTGPKKNRLSQIFGSTCQKHPLFSHCLGEIFNATCQKHPLFSHCLGEIFNATYQKHPLFFCDIVSLEYAVCFSNSPAIAIRETLLDSADIWLWMRN